MKPIGLFEAKTRLSEICQRVSVSGETIIVARRGKPLVRIEPIVQLTPGTCRPHPDNSWHSSRRSCCTFEVLNVTMACLTALATLNAAHVQADAATLTPNNILQTQLIEESSLSDGATRISVDVTVTALGSEAIVYAELNLHFDTSTSSRPSKKPTPAKSQGEMAKRASYC